MGFIDDNGISAAVRGALDGIEKSSNPMVDQMATPNLASRPIDRVGRLDESRPVGTNTGGWSHSSTSTDYKVKSENPAFKQQSDDVDMANRVAEIMFGKGDSPKPAPFAKVKESDAEKRIKEMASKSKSKLKKTKTKTKSKSKSKDDE